MEFRLPELGEGVYEAELVAWHVKDGDSVKRGQNLMEVLTDKATMEVPSPFAGTITALNAGPGDQLKVGQVVLSYAGVGQAEETTPPAVAEKVPSSRAKAPPASLENALTAGPLKSSNGPATAERPTADRRPDLAVKAAPSVRYMARKLGIDLAQVRGSGPGGRILIGDLAAQVGPATTDGKRKIAELRPDFGTPGTRIKLQGIRRKIAEHLVLSKRTIPDYSYVDECNVTELVRLREALREPFGRAGVKLTFLTFFVKAVTAALKEIPIVNASLDEQAGEMVLHDRYHIGVAVATPGGLIVPVIHDADRKDLAAIAQEIERLSSAARTGKVKLEELRGGTFTVTSVGNIGGLFSAPVINHPEVGILGVGKVVKRPVFDPAGNVRPADMVYLSFSFDHRVVDGAVGAAFGNAVIRQLQTPAAMLLPAKLLPN
jgi:pyruvate dehydrogenase E2 component (dihydrolipoamide acetyltransferase)/2-oxoisovalerate dehydrogenase E2 component (dihydrolipoyl transacylase)